MPKLTKISFLRFLSKPRFVHEISDHYGIPKKLAVFHLLKAVKSGQVLVSEKPVFKMLKTSAGRLKHSGEFVYVSRGSPMFVDGHAEFTIKGSGDVVPKSNGGTLSVRFISSAHTVLGKNFFDQRTPNFTPAETADHETATSHLKTDVALMKRIRSSQHEVKMVKRRTVDQLLRPKHSSDAGPKSLSYVETIDMLRALSKEALPFLNLHARFGISKQTLKRFAKKRLIVEVWGPRAIGVKFKLSKRGEFYLKNLESAAKYELKIKDKRLIRLKQKTIF
jgi:hypothetical protein